MQYEWRGNLGPFDVLAPCYATRQNGASYLFPVKLNVLVSVIRMATEL